MIDAFKGSAAGQIVEQQGIAVDVAAAVANHGFGVRPAGPHGPLPAIDRARIVSARAGDQAAGGCLLIGDLIHQEAGVEQPAIGKDGGADGGAGGLPKGHQAGPFGIAALGQLGPEFDAVGECGADRCGAQGGHGKRIAVSGIEREGSGAGSGVVTVDGDDAGARCDSCATDPITYGQGPLAEARHREDVVGDRTAEAGDAGVGAGAVGWAAVGWDVGGDGADRAQHRAQPGADHTGAVAVLNGRGIGVGDGAGDGVVQSPAGGAGGGRDRIDAAEVDVVQAALQTVELQVEDRCVVENAFAVAGECCLAPAEQRTLAEAAISQRH